MTCTMYYNIGCWRAHKSQVSSNHHKSIYTLADHDLNTSSLQVYTHSSHPSHTSPRWYKVVYSFSNSSSQIRSLSNTHDPSCWQKHSDNRSRLRSYIQRQSYIGIFW